MNHAAKQEQDLVDANINESHQRALKELSRPDVEHEEYSGMKRKLIEARSGANQGIVVPAWWPWHIDQSHHVAKENMENNRLIRFAVACLVAALSTLQTASAADITDDELGNAYLYCGILVNRINGGASQRGNFMLVIGSQLLGNKKLDEIRPNIDAAKEKVASDIKLPDAGFEKYSSCISMDNEKGMALFEKYKDALKRNASN